MEKTEDEYKYEIQEIQNMFPNAQFKIRIPIEEMYDVISDKPFIIVTRIFDCYCREGRKKSKKSYRIKGKILTYKYVIEQLIKQGLQLECDHSFLQGIHLSKSCYIQSYYQSELSHYQSELSEYHYELWTWSYCRDL